MCLSAICSIIAPLDYKRKKKLLIWKLSWSCRFFLVVQDVVCILCSRLGKILRNSQETCAYYTLTYQIRCMLTTRLYYLSCREKIVTCFDPFWTSATCQTLLAVDRSLSFAQPFATKWRFKEKIMQMKIPALNINLLYAPFNSIYPLSTHYRL